MDDGDRVSTWIAATAVERDVSRIAAEQPELWREVRRFNLPVKLALASAHRLVGALSRPRQARLIGLAPCRPGSPELRAISRELDAGFARGSCDRLRVNPIYTLHAIDNLALSALAIRLENREACLCLGGAAGQGFAALEQAIEELATDRDAPGAVDEVMLFGGDQSDASWRGERTDRERIDADAVGVAIVLSARPHRVRLLAVERSPRRAATAAEHVRPAGETPVAHAAAGLARWLEALAAAPPGVHRYAVPACDGDGLDDLAIVAEVA
jgi:hypothetical protein